MAGKKSEQSEMAAWFQIVNLSSNRALNAVKCNSNIVFIVFGYQLVKFPQMALVVVLTYVLH